MQAKEFSWDQSKGWTALDSIPSMPDLLLFFGHRQLLSSGDTYQALHRRFPRAVIAGASGGGQICSSGIIDEGITGLALKFRTSRVKIATSVLSDKDASFTVGENLARSLAADDLKGVLVLADGIEINGDLMSAGLAKGLQAHVVVGGGMAADDDRFKRTLVSGNGWPQPFLAAAVGFYGNDLQVTSGIGSGWQSTGKEFAITASRLNKLYDMDDSPALGIYEQQLGAEARCAGIAAASTGVRSSQGYAGMFDSGTRSRGLFRCTRCHSSLYLPPTRCRSGPVRLLPHWNGWSQTNSPAVEYGP